MKLGKTITIIILILVIVLYFFIPYFKVHNLTKKYGSEFKELYRENGFYNDIEYLKVFQYRDEKSNIYYLGNENLKKELGNLDSNYAIVLYVEENHSSASFFVFYDENGQWNLLNWNLLWSASGTADGFILPFYF